MIAVNLVDLLPHTLVLLNQQTKAMAAELGGLERLNVVSREIDYPELESAHSVLRRLAEEQQLDFLLFAQNDQVLDKIGIGETIRALQAGYSSFSGIDDSDYISQTRQCLEDFIAGQAALNLPPGNFLRSAWEPGDFGFSLIFDTEQMGGVRFGLPRILDLLEAYRVPATFFVTGLMATIYPQLLQTLKDRGHSIGVHGRYHEYLSQNLPTQVQQLATEKEHFEHYTRVKGANFFFRMNESTVEALIACGYQYFIVSMEHTYFPFAYRKMPVQPFQIWSDKGAIWMLPVSVETYNRPLTGVRLAADSAIYQARLEEAPTVNILMHPFRDGSLRHIGALEKLLKYLQARRSLIPTTIDHVVEQLSSKSPTAFIYVILGEGEMAGYGNLSNRGLSNWQWHNFAKYWQRIGYLYAGLKKLGHTPALCLSCPSRSLGMEDKPIFAVYPHLPAIPKEVITVDMDPLFYPRMGKKLLSVLERYTSHATDGVVVFRPGGLSEELKGLYAAVYPRQVSDLFGIFPEVAVRLAYKLTGYRHIF